MYIGFNSMNTIKDPSPTELATTLEDHGFESLWYGEHSHIPMSLKTPYPGGGGLPEPYKGMMDPYISLMAAASVTKNLKLGTGIALLLERELFSQAKTIAPLSSMLDPGRPHDAENSLGATDLQWFRLEPDFVEIDHRAMVLRLGIVEQNTLGGDGFF